MTHFENSNNQHTDTAENSFPLPPFTCTGLLRPIGCWSEMVNEMLITGVDFDEHWYSCVMEGVAYFYQWAGTVRATVLVVINTGRITYIESRQFNDQLVSEFEQLLIADEISQRYPVSATINGAGRKFH